MNTSQRILAATDLSAPARHAVERAFRLTAHVGGELHVLYAMEIDALDSLRDLLGANLSSVKAALEADARDRLEQTFADPARHRGVGAHTRVVSGALSPSSRAKPMHSMPASSCSGPAANLSCGTPCWARRPRACCASR